MGSDQRRSKPSGEGYAPITSGGAASALDLTNPKDQGLARQAMKNWPKRWRGLTEEFKDRCAKQLQIAIDEADSLALAGPEGIAEAAKIRLSAVKTAAMMEGQNQSDEHLLYKTTEDGEEKSTIRVVFEDRLRGKGGEKESNRV